jgi:hypothetical protein
MHRRERMMRSHPAVVFFIPLKHWEVYDPEEPEIVLFSSPWRSANFCPAYSRSCPHAWYTVSSGR